MLHDSQAKQHSGMQLMLVPAVEPGLLFKDRLVFLDKIGEVRNAAKFQLKNLMTRTICKIVLLDFVHHLNNKIKLQRFGS
jgi:hypothetical protein